MIFFFMIFYSKHSVYIESCGYATRTFVFSPTLFRVDTLFSHFSPVNKHDRFVTGVKCQRQSQWSGHLCVSAVVHRVAAARGWTSRCAALIGQASAPSRIALLSTCHYCFLRSTSPWAALGSVCPSPVGFGINHYWERRTMDATIYHIIFGELGDINCSLIDAFQDTFLENASLSLLSTDGKMELLPYFLVHY